MLFKFPVIHDEEISSIEKSLSSHTLVPRKQLKNFVSQLKKIDRSLEQSLQENTLGKHSIEKQKEMVSSLAGRCHHLKTRNDIINLAEEAEHLANTSPDRPHDEVASDANALRQRIDDFVKQNRPSRNNAKFIRFARKLLDKAERHEPVIVKQERRENVVTLDHYRTKDVTLKSYELAEALYELARLLYVEETAKFESSFKEDFSESVQKELSYHVSMCGGQMKEYCEESARLLIVQGILGYAHELTDYYLDNTPYPNIEEIHLTFEDLSDVNHIEDEDL